MRESTAILGKGGDIAPFPRPLTLLEDARTLLRKRKLCPNNLCHLKGSPHRTGTGCGNYDTRNPATNKYLNVAAFADPAPFTVGNTQFLPNARTCGYLNEDVSLQKEFQIHERVSVEIAADAQNLFNRHLWTGLNTNIDTVGTFGQYTGTTGPRLMQLHAKIVF